MNNLKLNILIVSILAAIVLLIGGGYFWRNSAKTIKVYVLYDSDKDERINWSQFQNLFPVNFHSSRTLIDIEELSKLDQDQRNRYDSLLAVHYSQPNLVKQNNGSNFYLTINPNEAVFLKKTKTVKQITTKELVNYPLISPDSLLKIIPGMEYLQIKNLEKIRILQNAEFYIIEPVPGSLILNIYNVEPIVEHYD